jgi:putative hemolysin
MLASAREIPDTLTEIGRLRELTFRDAGEGTGKATDLDEFDATYRHLFIYDDRARRLVGSYRLGLTDELIPARGPAGLYTATLFRYDHRHLAALTPGLELGRSFVRAEYQRHPLALLLLWQGIGHFVAANPRYRMLFGAASISDAYPSITRKLLVRFLTEAFGPGEFKALARPTTPPRFSRFRDRETELACETITTLEDADRLVAAIDPHNRGVPILLRQYLRLGARLIGFNVDPAFGDALDGLIVVDLLKAPRRHIERYMGAEGYQAFCQFHTGSSQTANPSGSPSAEVTTPSRTRAEAVS